MLSVCSASVVGAEGLACPACFAGCEREDGVWGVGRKISAKSCTDCTALFCIVLAYYWTDFPRGWVPNSVLSYANHLLISRPLSVCLSVCLSV